MASESHSTSLNELPNIPNGGNNMTLQSNQDNDLVNEILNEIDNQSNIDKNQSTFNRQMDNETNINRTDMPNPSPDEIQQMNNINQQNTLSNQYNDNQAQPQIPMSSDSNQVPVNQNMVGMNYQQLLDNQVGMTKGSSLFFDLKNSLLVTVLVFAILFFPKNIILSKIPKALEANGKVSLVGNGVIAIFAGILYFTITKYII